MTDSCPCSCDFDRDGFNSERWRTARKPNKCGECGAAIAPGEQYVYCWGVSDGRWYTHRMCRGCARMADHLMREGCCYEYGMLLECMADLHGLDYAEVG